MNRLFGLLVLIVFLLSMAGCVRVSVPQTQAAVESGYTYIPLDPFPVPVYPDDLSCGLEGLTNKEDYIERVKAIEYRPLLESLPDNAVRMSIEKFEGSGSVTYGPAGVGAEGESYRVTVDYVISDTTIFSVWVAKTAYNKVVNQLEYVGILNDLDEATYDLSSISYEVREKRSDYEDRPNPDFYDFNIPIYVGIGLRVTANVDVTGANANISGLGVIGAEAEANTLKGSLIVQTLGINGKSISAALPIQSELNRTTAQNAIVAVGSIKALLYDDKTATAPRIVGMYLPFPGGKALVNAIISELSSSESISMTRKCVTDGKD